MRSLLFWPALLRPQVPSSANPSSVVTAAWELDGALYVVGVNTGIAAVDASLQVPGLAARTLSVLGEAPNAPSSADALSDQFAPLAVHLYVAPPTAS